MRRCWIYRRRHGCLSCGRRDRTDLTRRIGIYESADAIIANFGNASDFEPVTFVAFYLLDGEQELIRMLN
jgi:hypothetical protein